MSDTMTLHVYAAHVQIPALVLTPGLRPIPSLAADRFNLRLDGGTPFLPSSVRLEGDDPIVLAVLIDAGGGEDRLSAQLAPALIRLRTVDLRPDDTLLLYAVDCKTVRYSIAIPANAPSVERALHQVLGSPDLHRGSTLPACGNSLRLWDTLSSMIGALASENGRRVVLAFSGGNDHGSRISWTTLRSYAALRSVAVFGMARPEIANNPHVTETPLWNVCALTGGLLLPTDHPYDLPGRMDDLLDLLRNRYILDFPRSNHLGSGSHTIDVQVVDKPRALVRLTGLTVPMLDQKLRDDPSTVPYLEADRPAVGERRPLPHNEPPQ